MWITKHRFVHFRSSLAAQDYDVPRSRLPASSLPSRHNTPVPKTPTPPPPPQTQQIYDVPVSKELPLELDSALEGLQRLQSEASAAIARLLGFVSPVWRTPQRLDATLMDLRLAALRLRTSLHDLAEFAEGNSREFSRWRCASMRNELRNVCEKSSRKSFFNPLAAGFFSPNFLQHFFSVLSIF